MGSKGSGSPASLEHVFAQMGKLKATVSSGHLQAIGQITVNFALLEHYIRFFIWDLISPDQNMGQIITA